MNYEKIYNNILKLYQQSNVSSFPIDCFQIMSDLNMRIFTYKELQEKNPELYTLGVQYSQDAFIYDNIMCYNTEQPITRVRFSLMHELGHLVLKHGHNPTPALEQEANAFASHILAPRIAIHYSGCKHHGDVARLFRISEEAAAYAFDSYRRWHRSALHRRFYEYEHQFYRHFYNKKYERFIYQITQCRLCEREMINSEYDLCYYCSVHNDENITNNHLKLVEEEQKWFSGEY